jgi:ribosomal protein S8
MNFLSDLLTCLRNAKATKLSQIVFIRPQGSVPKAIFTILMLLRKNGIIRGFTFKESTFSGKLKRQYIIYLKYDATGKSVLDSIFLVSKPSRRVYVTATAL